MGRVNLTSATADISTTPRVGNRIFDLWSADLPVEVQRASIDGDALGRCTKIDGIWRYVTSDYNVKCGSAAGNLHIQTNLPCSTNAIISSPVKYMYHFKLTGHNFQGREWYECHAVGYMESLAIGLSDHIGSNCVGTPASSTRQGGSIGVSQYCGAASGYLVLELVDSTPPERWHASDLIIDFIGGKSNYAQLAADHVAILAAEHNDVRTF